MFAKDYDARISALEKRVQELTQALREERDTREHFGYLVRDLIDFRDAVLAHFGLKFETVPETTRLVKVK